MSGEAAAQGGGGELGGGGARRRPAVGLRVVWPCGGGLQTERLPALLALLRDEAPELDWPPADDCCPCCSPDDAAGSDPTVTWIGCDVCDAWFHAPCVGLGAAEANALDDFLCPRCAAERGAAYAYLEWPPPLHRTLRPSLAQARELTAEVAAQRDVSAEMNAAAATVAAEVEAITALQRDAEAWSARFEAARHDAPPPTPRRSTPCCARPRRSSAAAQGRREEGVELVKLNTAGEEPERPPVAQSCMQLPSLVARTINLFTRHNGS